MGGGEGVGTGYRQGRGYKNKFVKRREGIILIYIENLFSSSIFLFLFYNVKEEKGN